MRAKTVTMFVASVFLTLGLVSCTKTASQRDNSMNSLDWAGVYEGTTPAADAEGINVAITLKDGQTFTRTARYLGKSDEIFVETGSFKWSEDGSVIILDIQNSPPYYKVGESALIQLDMDGKEITGPLAGHYVLKKHS